MSKIYLSRGLLLAGSVIALYSSPVFAQMPLSSPDSYGTQDGNMPVAERPMDSMPPSMMQAPPPPMYNSYNPANSAPPPPQTGSLGTLQRGDMAPPPPPPMNGMAPPMPRQQAADSYTSLQPMQSGEIRYVTGGIGDEERNAMQAMENEYDLHIMSATRNGSFAGDTQIKISSSKGTELLTTVAGPLFYADLPNGKYIVEALHDGATRRQNVTITHGKASKVHLSW